jgi:hypothetical protein
VAPGLEIVVGDQAVRRSASPGVGHPVSFGVRYQVQQVWDGRSWLMVKRAPSSFKLWFAAIAATGLVGMFSFLAPAAASAQNATLFMNLGNGLCLNSPSGGSVSMGNCLGANDWYIHYPNFNNFNIIDRHTGLCLEATHNTLGHVYTRNCGASIYQQWDFEYSPNPAFPGYFNDGTYQCLVGGRTGAVYMSGCIDGDQKQMWESLPQN